MRKETPPGSDDDFDFVAATQKSSIKKAKPSTSSSSKAKDVKIKAQVDKDATSTSYGNKKKAEKGKPAANAEGSAEKSSATSSSPKPRDAKTKRMPVVDKPVKKSAEPTKPMLKGDSKARREKPSTKDEEFASRQTRIHTLAPRELQEQEEWVQEKIQKSAIGICDQGYAWEREEDGYRCEGGMHSYTDDMLTTGQGGIMLDDIGPYIQPSKDEHRLRAVIDSEGPREVKPFLVYGGQLPKRQSWHADFYYEVSVALSNPRAAKWLAPGWNDGHNRAFGTDYTVHYLECALKRGSDVEKWVAEGTITTFMESGSPEEKRLATALYQKQASLLNGIVPLQLLVCTFDCLLYQFSKCRYDHPYATMDQLKVLLELRHGHMPENIKQRFITFFSLSREQQQEQLTKELDRQNQRRAREAEMVGADGGGSNNLGSFAIGWNPFVPGGNGFNPGGNQFLPGGNPYGGDYW